MASRVRQVRVAEQADPVPFAGVYAWYSEDPPTPARAVAGCPRTEWIHEGSPPWRVITARTVDELRRILPQYDVAQYTGDEPMVDVADWYAAAAP